MSIFDSAPKLSSNFNQLCYKRKDELVIENIEFHMPNNLYNERNNENNNKNDSLCYCCCCCSDVGTSTKNDFTLAEFNDLNKNIFKAYENDLNCIITNRTHNNINEIKENGVQKYQETLYPIPPIYSHTASTLRSSLKSTQNICSNSVNKIHNLRHKRLHYNRNSTLQQNCSNFKILFFKSVCLFILILETFGISLLVPSALFVHGKANEVIIDWTLNSDL